MKLKSLIAVGCLSMLSCAYAANRHTHSPEAGVSSEALDSAKKTMYPAYCEIEIINDSYDDVTVYGRFDDGSALIPFNVYNHEDAHYIDLFYNGRCHSDMYLDIVTFNNYRVYAGYTRSNSTVRIMPYATNQFKAEVRAK